MEFLKPLWGTSRGAEGPGLCAKPPPPQNSPLCRLAAGELWGLSRVKITPAACFPLPAGSLPGSSTASPGSSLASSAFVFGPGRAGVGGGKKAFGSAPCLSRVQHYQGSRLVSNISRCLSLLRSQVSSQDFLALGKIECLSEPSRPVFHLQPPGSDWVTVPALPGQPIPFCLASRGGPLCHLTGAWKGGGS